MTEKSTDSVSGRRNFLRNVLMDLPPKSAEEKERERRQDQRASFLALKYGKNVAELTRISVENPVRIDDTTYVVHISGHDSFGTRIRQELQVDIEQDTVGKRERETDKKDPNS